MNDTGRRITLSLLRTTLLAVLASGGCGDNTSAYLTEPPPLPTGYGVFYSAPEGAMVMWKKNPNLPLWDKAVVPLNVTRVGVTNNVIFGVREDPKTRAQSAFWVDTSTNTSQLDIPIAELDGRLKDQFGIANTQTVPAHFYDRNPDGGPR